MQESVTSSDTAQTVLKTSAVLEFESKLRARKAGDYSLPTPIRELDDMLQANTSTHTSRYVIDKQNLFLYRSFFQQNFTWKTYSIQCKILYMLL